MLTILTDLEIPKILETGRRSCMTRTKMSFSSRERTQDFTSSGCERMERHHSSKGGKATVTCRNSTLMEGFARKTLVKYMKVQLKNLARENLVLLA